VFFKSSFELFQLELFGGTSMLGSARILKQAINPIAGQEALGDEFPFSHSSLGTPSEWSRG